MELQVLASLITITVVSTLALALAMMTKRLALVLSLTVAVVGHWQIKLYLITTRAMSEALAVKECLISYSFKEDWEYLTAFKEPMEYLTAFKEPMECLIAHLIKELMEYLLH